MNMNTGDDNPEISTETDVPPQSTAVTFLGANGSTNDFPVLKAFQEYIDAEQAKARKRMVGLAAFFIVLLVVVVVTFTLIMTAFISRNQALSDKLLDIALKERPQAQPPVQPVVTVQPTVQQPAQQTTENVLKPVLEQLEKLATAVAKSQQQPAPAPVVVTTAPAPQPVAVSLPPTESAETIRLREELRKQQEALKVEQDKLKEAIRQAEIEKHRRRLYPEYYAREEAQKQKINREPTRATEGQPDPLPVVATPPPSPAAPQSVKPQAKASAQKVGATVATNAKPSKPINYFETQGEDEELKELLSKAKSAQQKPNEKVPTEKTAIKPVPSPKLVEPPKKQAADSASAKAKQESTAAPSKPQPQPAQASPAPVKQTPPAPVIKPETKPEVKTEVIAVGDQGTNAIPFLIEATETK